MSGGGGGPALLPLDVTQVRIGHFPFEKNRPMQDVVSFESEVNSRKPKQRGQLSSDPEAHGLVGQNYTAPVEPIPGLSMGS